MQYAYLAIWKIITMNVNEQNTCVFSIVNKIDSL